MQSVLIVQCNICNVSLLFSVIQSFNIICKVSLLFSAFIVCKVSILFSAVYTKCPYYVVIYNMHSVLIIQCFIRRVQGIATQARALVFAPAPDQLHLVALPRTRVDPHRRVRPPSRSSVPETARMYIHA